MLGTKIITFKTFFKLLHYGYQMKSVYSDRALSMTSISPNRTSMPLHRSCRQYNFLSQWHAHSTGWCRRKTIDHGLLRLPFLAWNSYSTNKMDQAKRGSQYSRPVVPEAELSPFEGQLFPCNIELPEPVLGKQWVSVMSVLVGWTTGLY